MIGVLYGRQRRLRACMAAVNAAGAAVTSSLMRAQPPSHAAVSRALAAEQGEGDRMRVLRVIGKRGDRPRGTEPDRLIEKFVKDSVPKLVLFQSPPRPPKWREVNPSAVVPGWTRFAAAEAWLQPSRQQVDGGGRRIEDANAARETATSGKREGAATEDVDRLFHEFVKWSQTREHRSP